ncbi:hypothetical protein [Moorena sp. SIO4G3]|nr:hypothetical protein [Moorena sp. SIO4G3]NEO82618.1 hypothetical protein [Moorena sp. SIO4G3]
MPPQDHTASLLPTPYGALSVGEFNSPRVAPLPIPYQNILKCGAARS